MDFAAMMAEERARAGLPTRGGAARAAPPPRPAREEAERPRDADAEALEAYLAEPFELAPGPRDEAARFRGGEWRVAGAETAHYVPGFVSEADERAMLAAADRAPPAKWTRLRRRELQNWGGTPARPFRPEPLPAWLRAVCGRLVDAGVFSDEARPNHVLLNRYRPGEGIAAHKDGPLYRPQVAILSLGAPLCIDFFESLADARPGDARRPSASLLLRPRSLLVFSGHLYHECWHEIAERDTDAIDERTLNAAAAGVRPGDRVRRDAPRVSLTCRHVPEE